MSERMLDNPHRNNSNWYLVIDDDPHPQVENKTRKKEDSKWNQSATCNSKRKLILVQLELNHTINI